MYSPIRRSLLWLAVGLTLGLGVASCAVFALDGFDGDAAARPSGADACGRGYSAADGSAQVERQTRRGSLKRDSAGCQASAGHRRGSRPAFAVAARLGIAELAGVSGDHSRAAWNAKRGLWWSDNGRAHWWQSALALRTLVRYLEHTGNTDPVYQHLILETYQRNVLTPQALASTNFVNKFLDDTAWWGLAWLEAAKYELRYRHDLADASTFLSLAEWDANAVGGAPKQCGGIAWQLGYPPDTIANAEFASLAAGLYTFLHAPGPLADPVMASQWLSQARSTVKWLVSKKLIDIHAGTVWDTLGVGCRTPLGGPITYTEGEVAEALTRLGIALHDRSYFKQADRFLRYVTSRASEMLVGGVLQERCESLPGKCGSFPWRINLPSYKGVFVQAVSDWSVATGSHHYRRFLLAQASSILHHDVSGGVNDPGHCETAHTCRFGFYWAGPVMPRASRLGLTAAAQASALDALTAVLPWHGKQAARPRIVAYGHFYRLG